MIIFSLVSAGNLLVNGWLSYMMLAPTESSAAAASLDEFSNAFSSMSNLVGT
jgi:hypothetical protein